MRQHCIEMLRDRTRELHPAKTSRCSCIDATASAVPATLLSGRKMFRRDASLLSHRAGKASLDGHDHREKKKKKKKTFFFLFFFFLFAFASEMLSGHPGTSIMHLGSRRHIGRRASSIRLCIKRSDSIEHDAGCLGIKPENIKRRALSGHGCRGMMHKHPSFKAGIPAFRHSGIQAFRH